MKVFSSSDYVQWINDQIESNSHVRGYQTRLAEAAGVHGSYLSRVLSGSVHLTPDQAANLAAFWRMDRDEAEYFLALVNLARAAAPALKEMLERQISELKSRNQELGKRFQTKEVKPDQNGIYYSAWHYGAIHMLVMVPGFHTVTALSARLGLPQSVVESALEVLSSLQLVKKSGSRWQIVETNVHMSNRTLWGPVYHANWRQRTAYRVFHADPDDIHFSGLHAVSARDFNAAKELLLDTVEKIHRLTAPSKEEDVFFIGVDAYRI